MMVSVVDFILPEEPGDGFRDPLLVEGERR